MHHDETWMKMRSMYCERAALIIITAKIFTLVLILVLGTINTSKTNNLPLFNSNLFSFREMSFTSRFATWDGMNYLRIAENGYQTHSKLSAFYPLWPGCIRLFSEVTKTSLHVSGFLLVNMFSLAGLFAFYKYTKSAVREKAALTTIILFHVFPGAIFFSMIYSESLYFLLSIYFFYNLQREKYILASFAGFLMPLTRAIGIFALAPLICLMFRTQNRFKLGICACCVIFGYLTYFIIIYYQTGDPFAGFKAQKQFPAQPSILKIIQVKDLFYAYVFDVQLHGMQNSIIDRFFFMVYIVSLPLVYRQGWPLFSYSLCIGLIPAFSSHWMSFSRYIIMVFPMFIAYGKFFAERKAWGLFAYYCGILLALQIVFLIRHINFYWAG